MDAIEFFDSEAIDLPKSRDTDDFLAFLERTFAEYVAAIMAIGAPDPISQAIAAERGVCPTLCGTIMAAVNAYLAGFPHIAFQEIDKAISLVATNFDRLLPPKNMTEQLQFMYRMRLGTGFAFTKKELFYIPFEKRYLVSAQRYSIPGLPCLY